MVYSDTSNKLGIIQAEEGYCEFGDGGISGNTTLLKEFTRHNNITASKIWSWIFFACNGSVYDDGNQTNLPQATQNLVSGTGKYALPSESLTVLGVEILDSNGNWVKLDPVSLADIQKDGAIGDFNKNSGTPSKYRWVGSTIILDNIPNYSSTNGFKVYFDRGSVSFSYTDTTLTPGFASEFHNAVAVGGSLEWLKVHKPNSSVLTMLMNDFAQYKVDIQKFYSIRYKNILPTRIEIKMENNK